MRRKWKDSGEPCSYVYMMLCCAVLCCAMLCSALGQCSRSTLQDLFFRNTYSRAHSHTLLIFTVAYDTSYLMSYKTACSC
jgi:hypothetical protein